jgi:hypothetical protein
MRHCSWGLLLGGGGGGGGLLGGHGALQLRQLLPHPLPLLLQLHLPGANIVKALQQALNDQLAVREAPPGVLQQGLP